MKASKSIRALCVIAIFLLVASLLFVWSGVLSAAAGSILRYSTTSAGVQANYASFNPSISSDGRYIAFESNATNLVSPDTNGERDIFRKDLQTGTIVRCTADASNVQGDDSSYHPSISADGRYVAFESNSTNLVTGDNNTLTDVFRKDLQTGAIVRCSTDSGGAQANGDSYYASISADGRYVAFESSATTLVSGDTSVTWDIFRKDLQTGAIVRCSTTSAGLEADNASRYPAISADGRYVALKSYATNLVSGDTNGWQDIFRKDLQTGQVVRCSTSSAEVQADFYSDFPSISADGRYVAYESTSTNLVSGDTNGTWDIFRKDLQTGKSMLCSSSAAGDEGGTASFAASISSDGRYVAFYTDATNLVSGDTNGVDDVFRKDLKTGAIVRCSTDSAEDQGNDHSQTPSINTDGKYVSFFSAANDLVPDDTNTVNDIFRKELALPAPALTSINPDTGAVGTDVTLTGTDFRALQMGGYVSFDGTQATDYSTWSDTSIKCEVPAGVTGNVDVTVTTAGGTSNAVEFTATTTTTFYFAEGYTGAGFDEWLCLGQPVDAPLDVTVTYLFTDGSTQVESYNVPGLSRLTVNVNNTVGADKEVSVKCEADYPFVAERPIYFNYQGAWDGGHDVVGASATSDTWYFAEGYTGAGFDEWICVLNPGDDAADLTFRFQTQEEGEKVVGGLGVPAHSRQTFKANDLLGGGSYQTSLKVESSEPVVAERPMYFNYQGTGGWNWTGGHCVMGVPSLTNDYYFAEGYTGAGFEEWLTLQNPGLNAIAIEAVYMLGTGEVKEVIYNVPAAKRSTIYVPDVVGADQDVSVRLTSPDPFLAERPMYFSYMGMGAWGWTGGHCVIGTPAASREWFFAEGYTGAGFEEWLCIQNPTGDDAAVTITYYPSGGSPIVKEPITVAANSRHTVFVNAHAGADLQISAEVASSQPVIVERPMYFTFKGWTGGHDVVGYTP